MNRANHSNSPQISSYVKKYAYMLSTMVHYTTACELQSITPQISSDAKNMLVPSTMHGTLYNCMWITIVHTLV